MQWSVGCVDGGRDWERAARKRERRENRASKLFEAAFVVWSAEFRYEWRLSTCQQ